MALPDDSITAEVPSWFLVAVPLLGLGLVVVMGLGVAGVWMLIDRAKRLERLASRLDVLDAIAKSLKASSEERAELDLRRIEHVLMEIRDAQSRLDQTLQRALDRPDPGAAVSGGTLVPAGPRSLGERVTNRLAALGYERIQILTPVAELDELAGGDGDVLVEARRFGSLCKGRVQIKAGTIGEVRVQPSYSTFP